MTDDERDEILVWVFCGAQGLAEAADGYRPFDPAEQAPADDVDDVALLLAASALPAGSLAGRAGEGE